MKLFLSLVCVFSLCAQVAQYHLTYLGQKIAMHQDVDRTIDEHNAYFKNAASKMEKSA